jgi:hypothetical protein
MNQEHPKEEEATSMGGSQAGPSAIIYKTKADYYNKIPVILSEDKSKIVSYPGPRDIITKGKLAYPTKLNDGFLLDNRGINENVAFLDITYEVFSKSMKAFTSEELFEMILDDDPITEMYNCGSKYKYKEIESELNDFIEQKDFRSFKKIK